MVDVLIPFSAAAAIIFLGFIGNIVFERIGLPDIPFLIFFGIILGPLLNVFPKNSLITIAPYFTALTLIIILFGGGMEMNIERVVKRSGRAILLALSYFTLCTVTTFLLAVYALHFKAISALLFGPMIAGTSSVVIIPLASELGLRRDTSLTISLESAITDVLNIVFMSALLDAYFSGQIAIRETLILISSKFSVGIVIGFILGVVWLKALFILRKHKFTYMLTMAVVIATYIVSEYLGGSGVMAVFMFGLILGNQHQISSFLKLGVVSKWLTEVNNFISSFQYEMTFLMRSFFFVFLGSLYDPYIFPIGLSLAYATIVVSINLLARYTAVTTSTLRSPLKKDKNIITLLCGQGLAHAVLCLIPLQYGLPHSNIYIAIVTTVIIITNLITATSAFMFKRQIKTKSHGKKS